MHTLSRGQGQCALPDGHPWNHKSIEAKQRGAAKWNRSQASRDAASRYRNRHPAQRALTVIKQTHKKRQG